MSDETDNGSEGVLGKVKLLADRVGDYARSDEAREKLDALKKKAAEAGKVASAGVKKVAESTKQAAVQAREKADEFSKSERGQALKAKAKGDWDDIRGGTFRGFRFSNSPLVIALAIFLFFPLGLFLLWKHPVLGRSKAWWGIGGVWGVLVSLALFADGNASKRSGSGNRPGTTVTATDQRLVGENAPEENARPARRTEQEAVRDADSFTHLAALARLEYQSYGPLAPLASFNGSAVEPLEKQIVKEFWEITEVYSCLLVSEVPEFRRNSFDIRGATLKNIESRYGVSNMRINDILIKGGQWIGQGLVEPVPSREEDAEAWVRRLKAKYEVQWPIEEGHEVASTAPHEKRLHDKSSRINLYGDHYVALSLIKRTLDDPELAEAPKVTRGSMSPVFPPDEVRAARLKMLKDRHIQYLATSYKTDPSSILGIIDEGDRNGWAKPAKSGRPTMIVPASAPHRGSFYAHRPGLAERQVRDGWLADNGDAVTIESRSGRVALFESFQFISTRADQFPSSEYERFVLYVPSPVKAVIETSDEMNTEILLLDGPYLGCRGWVSKQGLRFTVDKPSR